MKKFNYDSYMRDNPLLKEAEASKEIETSDKEKMPDFQRDLKVYGIKVSPTGDKKKRYSGSKSDLHSFVMKYWGRATANSIDETSGYGNYTPGEKMLEKEDYIDSDEYDYMTSDETDDAEKTGRLSPHGAPLGPDEELLEGSGKVAEVYSIILENIKTSIKKYGLDQDDVQELREKLAAFFK